MCSGGEGTRLSDPVQNHNDDGHESAARQLWLEIEALESRLRVVEESLHGIRAKFQHVISLARQLQPQSIGVAPNSLPPSSAGRPAEEAVAGASAPPPSGAAGNAHEEARRYARLLVAEIELYNPSAVAEGLEKNDLYARLKAHIDRSRRAYEQRFGGAGRPDYFDEAMVRVLAQGDPSRLGPEYPFH